MKNILYTRFTFPVLLVVLAFLFSCSAPSDKTRSYTRGIGMYPGDESENFAPVMKPANQQERNLALHRASWHSSSYDYNLTAQLVTDGIRDTVMPWRLTFATSQENTVLKNEREWLTDDNPVTTLPVKGSSGWIQGGLLSRDPLPEVDGIKLIVLLRSVYNGEKGPWRCTASGSEDGKTWEILGKLAGNSTLTDTSVFPYGDIFTPLISFTKPAHYRYYHVDFQAASLQQWNIGEFVIYDKQKPLEIKPSHHFISAWMGAGKATEWVYTDLGTRSDIDSIVLAWIRPAAEGMIQVSDDAAHWEDIHPLTAPAKLTQKITLGNPVKGRYVRVLMTRPVTKDGYVLSEMEVYGKGGLAPVPKDPPALQKDSKLYLSGGNWKLQRGSLVHAGGKTISQAGYHDVNWLPATVPATVLVSYLNVGAVPDPNYGDNQLMISESFFLSDFWYRNTFNVPSSMAGKHLWLNFDGINWKADVFLNGKETGPVDGAFTRGRFDVTKLLIPGKKNVIAIRILKNASPGGVKEQTFYSPDKNGGVLGADNPTFHATIGWDWIPTIRGRDAGIWNDVYLSASGPVTIQNPFVTTTLPLPDTSYADVTLRMTLQNHEDKEVHGILHGFFGTIAFNRPVVLKSREIKTIELNPLTHKVLKIHNPRLWWPNGYGQPNLYPVKLTFVTENKKVSDTRTFNAGIRQMRYSEDGGVLRIWVNGKRFTGRGGNWGFSESMLRYRAREYDIAVRYHRDMHFTMIRNWVGQTGDDEFFDACDKYGILVWQDFWLANPWDGPDPDNNRMFLQNAKDFVLRIRNHPSIGLYCGRNEGYPPQPLEDGIRKILKEYHPDIHYIPNSAADVVSGHGPYRAMPVKYYFSERATKTLHSEMGMPNIVTMESLRAMMPDSALWPQKRMWGLHDFCANGAQGAASFREIINEEYGGANNIEDWDNLAQFVNYDGYRAMFEAQGRHRMGLLLWMSHPAWPSLVWQTYDYYFEPTAAYFGCKKASEPLHILWNPLTDSIEVVNYSGRDAGALTASVQILNMNGTIKWQKEVPLNLPEDQIVRCLQMKYPKDLTPVHFIRLKLLRHSVLLSRNFYLRGVEEGNYQAIRKLPKVKLTVVTNTKREGAKWHLTTDVTNTSEYPALMVRLKVIREKSGDRILPVIYSDNYISLMPGEKRTIHIELEQADTRGERPAVSVAGFNVAKMVP